MKNFDFIVIGSGAGLMVIEAALAQGKKCAIIEKSKFGGTCLTKGCIPSKMLVYPADTIRAAENAKRIGLNIPKGTHDWKLIEERVWKQINFCETIEKNLKNKENLTVFNGTARFTGKKTVEVLHKDGTTSEEITGDKIVIACGARTFVPPIKNLEKTGYATPESFFGEKYAKEGYKRLIIIGAGAIGAEFTHIYSAFGAEQVTLIEAGSRILATEEEEVGDFVENQFNKLGNIKIIKNAKIMDTIGYEKGNSEGFKKEVIVESEGVTHKVYGDEIFVATGVRPNSDYLSLENTEVEVNERGWIKSNEYLETTQKDIYVIGDANGKYQFRHTANYEASILINNLFTDNCKKAACYNTVPWAIFTYPQVAHVGMTEKQVKDAGLKYWVGRNYYANVAYGIAMGIGHKSDDNGFIKLIIGEDSTILGVHIVGPYAAMLLQPFVYLMNASQKCEINPNRVCSTTMCPELGTYNPILDSMVIHPSLSELTAWVLENIDWNKK
jgi:mycothione reductase